MKYCQICLLNRRKDCAFLHELYVTAWDQMYICRRCYQQFTLLSAKVCCQQCQKIQAFKEICTECQYWQKNYDILPYNKAIWEYNAISKDLLWRIKNLHDLALMEVFIQPLCQYFTRNYDLANTVFVPMPSSYLSLEQRGFSLISLILSAVKKRLNISTFEVFCIIEGKTKHQHNRAKHERMNYAKTKLQCYPFKTNKNVIIVDDVYTTGASIMAATRTLYAMGQRGISSFTLFR